MQEWSLVTGMSAIGSVVIVHLIRCEVHLIPVGLKDKVLGCEFGSLPKFSITVNALNRLDDILYPKGGNRSSDYRHCK